MKSTFPKHLLSASPKIEVAIQMSSSEMTSWKRALHKYVHMCTHTYICGKVFSPKQCANLVLTFEIHFFGMAVNAFLEKSSSYRDVGMDRLVGSGFYPPLYAGINVQGEHRNLS